MLFSRRRIKSFARSFAVLLAGLWLAAAAAPCVMAETDCHDPGCAQQMLAEGNGAAVLDCQLPNPNPPTDVSFAPMAIAPVVVALLPAAPAPDTAPPRQWVRSALNLPFTPLNLQHARLLI
jgi:hypothetical protein